MIYKIYTFACIIIPNTRRKGKSLSIHLIISLLLDFSRVEELRCLSLLTHSEEVLLLAVILGFACEILFGW